MPASDTAHKKTLIQTHLIVDAGDFERFSYDDSKLSLTEAVLADRTQLRDIALIKTTIIATPVDWKFIASRLLPQAIIGWSHDRTDLRDIDPLSTSGSALYISADIAQGNIAEVTDFTNKELGSLGLNSWLIDQALQAFLQVSGPDPWIKGELSPVDNENEDRLPFWQRHVGQTITVNSEGGGHFCAPWVRGFNPYRMKVKPILIYQDGELPRRIDNPGLTLCNIDGRLACQAHKGFAEIG